MKFSLKLDIPDPARIVADLSTDADPAVVQAREALATAEAAVVAANARLHEARQRVTATRANYGRGFASLRDVNAALADERTLALAIGPHEQTAAEARDTLAAELTRAGTRLRMEGERRIAPLLEAAQQIAPLLEAIRATELALDQVVPRLPAVEWPQCVSDEASYTSALRALRTSALRAVR